MEIVSLHKCLSDPTRLRIVHLLLRGPLCVCELQEALDEPQVKMSKHIGYMRRQGLLKVERKANWNFYRISPNLSESALASLEAIRAGYTKDPQLSQDLKKLEYSPGAACR